MKNRKEPTRCSNCLKITNTARKTLFKKISREKLSIIKIRLDNSGLGVGNIICIKCYRKASMMVYKKEQNIANLNPQKNKPIEKENYVQSKI